MARPQSIVCIALALSAGACSAGEEGRARPNVLLISVDTLRADHLGAYGYDRPTAPVLDALAAEGVLFERALSTSSWTLPAHLTMLTGLPVSAHGVCDDRLWTRADGEGRPIPPPLRGRFVSERLAAAGYRTAGFYTWKYLETQFGFGPGFEVWERHGHSLFSHPETGPAFERLREAGDVDGMKALAAAHPELPTEDGAPSAEATVDRAMEWLAGLEGQDPFFLFVHLFDVHDPYVPPPPFDTLFDADYDGPIDGRRVTTEDSLVRGDMPPEDLAHLVALYDGGIAWVDWQIDRLLSRLAELGYEEDTLVIVTSDHGEEFFEHGHKTHRRQLYMESVHVPLIVRWPGELPKGARVGGTVGLIDVAPTICAAAGVELEGAMGTDLLPFARGAPNTARTYASELLLFDGTAVPERHLSLVRGDEQALLLARGASEWSLEVFDLAANPHGEGAGNDADPAGREVHLAHLARLREAITRLRTSLADRGGELPPLSEHDKNQLAAMGYALGAGEFGESDETRLCFDGCVWPD